MKTALPARTLVLAVTLAVTLAATLSACGGDAKDPKIELPTNGPVTAPPTGLVQGRLLRVGGPAGSEPTAVAGTLTFSGSDGSIGTTDVDASGRYAIALNPGVYTITGTSPAVPGTCRTEQKSTTLTAGETTTVDVLCTVK